MSLPRLLVCCLLVALSLAGAPAQAPAPDSLAANYLRWADAMRRGDADAWARETSPLRQRELRNEVVSRGETFPAALFRADLAPPSLDGLRLIATRSSAVACHLFYLGKVDFGLEVDDIPDGLLLLRFLHEDEQWRFNSLSYYPLAAEPELTAALRAGRLDVLRGPEFAPPEQLPAVVAEVDGPPELIAQLYLRSPFHRVQLRVNGVDHTYEVSGATGAEPVIGGLRRGANTVMFGIEELPGVPHPYPVAADRLAHSAALELSLWLVPAAGSPLRQPRCVWRWTAESPEDLPTGAQETTFQID